MSLAWEDYFMGMALLAGLKSKDTYSKNGAIIIDKHKRIISTGYNGLVAGIDESEFNREKVSDNFWETKYPYLLHAEENAILHATNIYLDGAIMYCKKFPCNECAKKIAQKRIKEVVYYELKHPEKDMYVASMKILDLSGVKHRKYEGKIDFKKMGEFFDIEGSM